MLVHPTHQRLRALKLDGMADAFAELQGQNGAAELSHAEARSADRPRGTDHTG